MPVLRQVHAPGWCVRLDLSAQVLGIEVPEVLLRWSRSEVVSAPLLPNLPATRDGAVSAATLLLQAKLFDDGLYAAVELAAQHGAGRFAGKRALLQALATTLTSDPSSEETAAFVLAACNLGGHAVEVPPSMQERIHVLIVEFLRNQLVAKPLGFYTWTPELSAIFRQDRFLQQPLEGKIADALSSALQRTRDAGAIHTAWQCLNARLSNPPARPGLGDDAPGRAFLPPSRSHEQVLLERLFGDRSIPDGFDLMTELIRRVRSGAIQLEPTASSGWYDHQTYSLEPLIVPERMLEAARLELGGRYRQHLEDLFRGALALARETHVKQLAVAVGGCAGPRDQPIWIRPSLTVEPLPSLFARRAESYRFVRTVLEEAFGASTLEQMCRLTQDGSSILPLAEELTAIEELFDGAAATARRELGMEPLAEDEQRAGRFASWKGNLAAGQDVSRDCRMMVPVFYDLQRKKTKVWAFLGWRTLPVDVEYRKEPKVLGVERAESAGPDDRLGVLRRKFRGPPVPEPHGSPAVEFRDERHEFAVPVLAEVYVSRLLDRDEFRRHCDRYGSREGILANLS